VEEYCKVSPPINFNCWKHHASFIKKQIEIVKSVDELERLRLILRKIGESQMDLYFGGLSPADISNEIIDYLKKEKIFLVKPYIEWLNEKGSDYRLINLSDESAWTLRLGENAERYVHIHPGRYSLNTRRVKALTLKTAIITLCCEKLGEPKLSGKELINKMRIKYLGEPPLKSISVESGLGKLLELLR
jgi:hypothetical protein